MPLFFGNIPNYVPKMQRANWSIPAHYSIIKTPETVMISGVLNIPANAEKVSMVEAGGIEPPSESPLQSVLHT